MYKFLVEIRSTTNLRFFSLLEDHIKRLNLQTEFLYVAFYKEVHEELLKNRMNGVLLTNLIHKSSLYKKELSNSEFEIWCGAERTFFGSSYNEKFKYTLESYIAAYSYIFNELFMPDCILTWDWENMYRHGLSYIAEKLQIKMLFFERCCFPNTSIIDSQGVNINNSLRNFDFNQVDVDYNRLNDYLEQIREQWSRSPASWSIEIIPKRPISYILKKMLMIFKLSMGLQKYFLGLELSPYFRKTIFHYKLYIIWAKLTKDKMLKIELQKFQELKKRYNKIIFIPLQGNFDLSLVRLLQNNIPKEIALIFKSHPATIGLLHPDVEKLVAADKRSLLLHMVSIYDLIKNSMCVVTRNSAVGLQAMVYRKPVFVTGEAYWAPQELRITEEDNIFGKIMSSVDQKNQILYDKILYKLIFQYLQPIDCLNPTEEQLRNSANKILNYIDNDVLDSVSP